MISDVRLIQLPKISDARGNLTFIENSQHIPFDIKRVYYLYDIPAETDRGEHAHKKLQQLIIPLSGSFELTLDDGFNKQNFILKRPWEGLYICPMLWRELNNFTSGATCLVLASEVFSADDYIRDYNEFIRLIKLKKDKN